MRVKDLNETGLPPVVERMARLLRSFETEIYLVGGSVRDLLLGRAPKDLDFLVFGAMESFARRVARAIGGKALYLGQNDKALWRVIGEELELDFVAPRGPDLLGDLRGRDFTVNALAWSIREGRVVDLVGGLQDLDRRLIRMTRADVFLLDPVRLLRAFRFAATLGFTVDGETLARIASDRELLRGAAPERIGAEFLALLGGGSASDEIRAMGLCGLLDEVLQPDGKAGMGKDEEGAGERLDCAVAVLEFLERTERTPAAVFPEHPGAVGEWFGEGRNRALLKLALLLLGAGDGLLRFPTPVGGNLSPLKAQSSNCLSGHGNQSSARAPRRFGRGRERAGNAAPEPFNERIQAMGERLALSNKDLRLLSELVAGHPTPFRLSAPENSGDPTEKSMPGVLRLMGRNTVGLLVLALGVRHARRRSSDAGEEGYARLLEASNKALHMYFNDYLPRTRAPRWINGADLEAEGAPPGPLYREILEEVEAMRLEGRLADREAALAWVRRRLADYPEIPAKRPSGGKETV